MHVRSSAENACDLNSISWLDAVNKVILQDDLDTARKLTRWCALWHFLNRDNLRVLVKAVAILVGKCVSILVFDRESLSSIVIALMVSSHLG